MSNRKKNGDRRSVEALRALLVVDAATSARMRMIRRSDTSVERAVRKLAHGVGLRYRVRNNDLPGSPDLANRACGWAVFVHGCFWHGHDACRKSSIPLRNRAYWKAKLEANKARDQRATRALRGLGFRALTIWECQAFGQPIRVASKLKALLHPQKQASR